jgi:hypothetical protein
MRHAAAGNKALSIERLSEAATSFNAAIPAYDREASMSALTIVAFNVLSVAGAATQARINAQQMAAISSSGKGMGIAFYQTGDPSAPIQAGSGLSAVAAVEAASTQILLDCVSKAASSEEVRACLP